MLAALNEEIEAFRGEHELVPTEAGTPFAAYRFRVAPALPLGVDVGPVPVQRDRVDFEVAGPRTSSGLMTMDLGMGERYTGSSVVRVLPAG